METMWTVVLAVFAATDSANNKMFNYDNRKYTKENGMGDITGELINKLFSSRFYRTRHFWDKR